MPAWFRKHDYTTVSVGKVSHHPGGRGGDRWDDNQKLEMPDSWDRHLLPAGPWQDPRGWMHGLANGEIRDDRRKPGGGIEMDVMQAVDGPDSIYPDGVAIDEALRQMDLLRLGLCANSSLQLASCDHTFLLVRPQSTCSRTPTSHCPQRLIPKNPPDAQRGMARANS